VRTTRNPLIYEEIHMTFLNGSTHHDDNMVDGPACITHPRGHNQLTTKGESFFDSTISLPQFFL
jgi:hypothetical protein